MIKSDWHIHSECSYDAKIPLEEIATNAKAYGFVNVGITDHANYNDEQFLGDLDNSAKNVLEFRKKHPEMILGVELMKHDGPTKSATLVPLVFPLIAGAGTLTTLLSLRAEYAVENIIVAIILNMIFVYLVLAKLKWIEKFFGEGLIYVLRKFFGIILLAIAVKLFATNISSLLG